MAQPYIGEIRIFAGNFAPMGWAFCDGSPVPISENEALFQLIGTIYGGDGESTFHLPDLRGRLPMHQVVSGSVDTQLGFAGGVEEVTLTVQQIPVHTHPLRATTAVGTAAGPQGGVLAASGSANVYRPASAVAAMSAQSVLPVGGSQPHTNLQPFLCVNHIISLYGIFPSPT